MLFTILLKGVSFWAKVLMLRGEVSRRDIERFRSMRTRAVQRQ